MLILLFSFITHYAHIIINRLTDDVMIINFVNEANENSNSISQFDCFFLRFDYAILEIYTERERERYVVIIRSSSYIFDGL